MILLDTHVVVWLLTAPDRLSALAARGIAENDSALPCISAATLFEFAYARQRGRVRINVPDAEFMNRMRQSFEILPITGEIALQAAQFSSELHGDPMDRMIVATALIEKRTLITADEKILAANLCKVLW